MREKLIKGLVMSIIISSLSILPVCAAEITTSGTSPVVVSLTYEGEPTPPSPVTRISHDVIGIKVVYVGDSIACDEEIDKTKISATYIYKDTYSDGNVVNNIQSTDPVPTEKLSVSHGDLHEGVNTFTVTDQTSGKSADFTASVTNPERDRVWNGIIVKYTYAQSYTTDTVKKGLVTIYKTVRIEYADGTSKTVATTENAVDSFHDFTLDHTDVKEGKNVYKVKISDFTGTFTVTGIVKETKKEDKKEEKKPEEKKETKTETTVVPAPEKKTTPTVVIPPVVTTKTDPVIPAPKSTETKETAVKTPAIAQEELEDELEKELMVKIELEGKRSQEIIKDNDEKGVIRNAADILSELIDDDDLEAYKNGTNISIVVNISDKKLPKQTDLLAIAEGLPSTYTAGTTFTVSIDKLYDGEIKTSYTTLTQPVIVSIPIPGSVLGANRKISLMGVTPTDAEYMYKVEFFEDKDSDDGTYTFATRGFESYVFIYEDVALAETIPEEPLDDKAIDIGIRYDITEKQSSPVMMIVIGVVLLLVAAGVVVFIIWKRRSEEDE